MLRRILQNIQNSLARAVTRTPKSSHVTPVLESLHWLKINERIKYKLLSLTSHTNLNISTTWALFNLLTKRVLHLWLLLLVHRRGPFWMSVITLFDTMHLLCGMNCPLNSASLVRHSLLHWSHMAVHHLYHLHYYHFHLLSRVHSFILISWLGYLANPFRSRLFFSPTGLIPRTLGLFNVFLFCSSAGFACMVY